MNIEPLESRIAPASASVTYIDIDNDVVKITVTTPGNTPPTLDPTDLAFTDFDFDGQLGVLDLTDPSFQNASVTFTVTKKPGGDGMAHVGHINATGRDLVAVMVKGDLGAITAGDGTTATGFAVKSLVVQSFGAFGFSTGAPADGSGTMESHLTGALGTLTVRGDLRNAWLHVTGNGAGDEANGKIFRATIGGSLIGGSTLRGGGIESSGDIGVVKIGRDIRGGVNTSAGFLQSDLGKIKSVTLGGSLIGGDSDFTGTIRSGSDLGPVKIAGNVIGGRGNSSGFIASDTGFGVDNGEITNVTIGGSLVGSIGASSGAIRGANDMGPITIRRDIIGGAGNDSGKIDAQGKLTSLRVAGSIIGSTGRQDADFGHAGQIHADGKIGSIAIGGSLIGGNDPTPDDMVREASFSGGIGAFSDVGSLAIRGSVLGGFAADSCRIFISGSLGSLIVHGSFVGLDQSSSAHLSATSVGSAIIGGDVIGAPNQFNSGQIGANQFGSLTVGGTMAGKIRAGSLGAVKIGGDLNGTAGAGVGFIDVTGPVASVTIGGSILGASASSGSVNFTGGIRTAFAGDLGPVRIAGDIIGGSISGSALLNGSGLIESGGSIASVFVGGSIVSGSDFSSSVLLKSAAIRADGEIGPVTIRGSLLGNERGTTSPVVIAAGGLNPPSATSNIAIKSLRIGGRVELAKILAGFAAFDDMDTDGSNGNASIGAVSVGGDWFASSISAGVADGGLTGFGTPGDHVIDQPPGAASDAIIARIASITIRGAVIGAANPFFQTGFTAQQIGSFKAAGFIAALTTGTDTPIVVAQHTQNVTIREI